MKCYDGRTIWIAFICSLCENIIAGSHIMAGVEFTVEPVVGGNVIVVTDCNGNRIISSPFATPTTSVTHLSIYNGTSDYIGVYDQSGQFESTPIDFYLGNYTSLCISNHTGVELHAIGDNETVTILTGASRFIMCVVSSNGFPDVADGGECA